MESAKEHKMQTNELIKRYILFIISLFISAMGVALTKKAELGVSPISSVSNLLSLKFEFLSLGNWLIIWNCLLIMGQILLLRKRFKPIQLLQLPLSFLFGFFTDFCMWLVSFLDVEFYPLRIAFVLIGTVVLALGVALAVIANVIMNSGEAFVKAVSDVTHIQFGNVKIVFDIACILTSVILSLVFFSFTIQGTREGTIIAALLTGIVVKLFLKTLSSPMEKRLINQKIKL